MFGDAHVRRRTAPRSPLLYLTRDCELRADRPRRRRVWLVLGDELLVCLRRVLLQRCEAAAETDHAVTMRRGRAPSG